MRSSEKKVVYYTDELNDDFAGTSISAREVGEDYKFVNRNPIWRAAATFFYRGIATPIVYLVCKLGYGLRIKNRKAIKKLGKQGFFMYSNHTQDLVDSFSPTIMAFPQRAHIIANADAVSITGLGQFVAMLGVIPVPTGIRGMRQFKDAIEERYRQGRAVMIYPEAHIWPYYTGIRPFTTTSFSYPVKLSAPCVACVTTYRKRKLFKRLRPQVTITVSEPFYPDSSLSEREAKQKLRDEIYGFMKKTAERPDNFAYIEYHKKESGFRPSDSAAAAIGAGAAHGEAEREAALAR